MDLNDVPVVRKAVSNAAAVMMQQGMGAGPALAASRVLLRAVNDTVLVVRCMRYKACLF